MFKACPQLTNPSRTPSERTVFGTEPLPAGEE